MNDWRNLTISSRSAVHSHELGQTLNGHKIYEAALTSLMYNQLFVGFLMPNDHDKEREPGQSMLLLYPASSTVVSSVVRFYLSVRHLI